MNMLQEAIKPHLTSSVIQFYPNPKPGKSPSPIPIPNTYLYLNPDLNPNLDPNLKPNPNLEVKPEP